MTEISQRFKTKAVTILVPQLYASLEYFAFSFWDCEINQYENVI